MTRMFSPVLGQINIVVQDMDVTLTFYRRLGLTIEAEPGAPHVAVELPGGLLVEFDEADLVAQWDTGWSGSVGGSTVLGFWLPSRDAVDEVYSDLVGAGHTGHQPPYDAFWGGRYAIVDDPSGNGVGLMSPTDEAQRYWPPTGPPAASRFVATEAGPE